MKYLLAILGFIASLGAVFGYREKSKRNQLEADIANETRETLSRQSEAVLKQQKESDRKINEAKHTPASPDDIASLYD